MEKLPIDSGVNLGTKLYRPNPTGDLIPLHILMHSNIRNLELFTVIPFSPGIQLSSEIPKMTVILIIKPSCGEARC